MVVASSIGWTTATPDDVKPVRWQTATADPLPLPTTSEILMPKLLIVDDALTDRVRVSGIASHWENCTILEADNGRTALDQIEKHLPDLVLTDLHMPEMDGLQLVAAVKLDFPNIPVVLMTAKGSEEIAAKALRHGAASYVPKIRLADDLLATLSEVYSTAQDANSQSRVMHYLSSAVTEFVLPNDVSLIRPCVSKILEMLRCLPLGDESERLRVGIALREAILNACYHGNLEVKKEAGNDSSRYDSIAASRMYESPYYGRRIHVQTDINSDRVRFVIRDEGGGFDVEAMQADDSIRGRGVTLMKSVMDEVSFNQSGNEVRMVIAAVRDDEVDDDEVDDDEVDDDEDDE